MRSIPPRRSTYAVMLLPDWVAIVAAMAREGADLRIAAGADSILLEVVLLADLDPADFLF